MTGKVELRDFTMTSSFSSATSVTKTERVFPWLGRNMHPLWWLFISGFLFLFADGPLTVALAAWLAPVCLLRFVRTQTPGRGLALAYGMLVVARGIVFFRMIPIPGIFYVIFMFVSGISALLPYLADRLLTARLGPVLRTFVFAVVLVGTQFVYEHGPFGSWGSIAYSQTGNLALLQVLSVTGLWGITFLIGWCAAVANEFLEKGIGSGEALRSGRMFGGVFLTIIIFGLGRLTFFPPNSETVRVASLSPAQTDPKIEDKLLAAVIAANATPSEVNQFRVSSSFVQEELLARSESEARAGAKIVFWSEEAAVLLKQDELALLSRGCELAAKYRIYLGMALAVWSQRQDHPLENKLVMITPEGKVAWQYLKARPTPGPEASMSAKSEGIMPDLNSPYGRLTTAICYDTDFPGFMKQAGRISAAIVLSPANDWMGVNPRHTEIANFRAIEQGFNLVRQASNGLSAAYDYQGHTLASMDGFRARDFTLVAQLPTRGVTTIYSYLGDWLAWLCCGATVTLLLLGRRKQIRN